MMATQRQQRCQQRTQCCCWALLAGALASLTLALTADAVASERPIPLTCKWSDWAPVSGRHCRWRNRTTGVVIQDRHVSKFVTYCSQLLRTRHKVCESEAPQAEAQLQEEFLEPSGFIPSSEHPDDELLVARQSSDECTDDKCGPLDGQWCFWIIYGGCDFHCRHAAKNETEVYIQKQRLCHCPKPRNNGKQCQGASSQRERCHCVSLAASFTSFLRTTEGILIAVGVAVVVLVLIACCISRVCCDSDDAAEDFKIGELPQPQPSPQQQQIEGVDTQNCAAYGGSGAIAETDLCSLPGNTTDSTTATSDEATSLVVRLPDCLQARQEQLQMGAALVPPPLPPKRYKQQRQQQRHHCGQFSLDESPLPIKYTPPFPNEA